MRKDKQRSGRPSEIDLSELKHLIEEEPTLTLASRFESTHSTLQYHFEPLQLVSKLDQWVYHMT